MIRAYETPTGIPENVWNSLEVEHDYAPFLNYNWYETLSKNVRSRGKSPIIFALMENGTEFSSILPCWNNRVSRFYSPRVLESLSNYYSPLYSPLVSKSHSDPEGAIQSLISELADSKSWDVMHFQPMDPKSLAYSGLINAFKHLRWPVLLQFCFGNWYQPVLEGGFDTYFNNRPSRVRNTLKRKWRRFAATPGASIRIITEAKELQEGLKHYTEVYENSWKVPEQHPCFIHNLMRLAVDEGWLRLGIARIGEVPVAAQFWIVAGRSAFIYKLAYDQAYKALSPGSLLTMEMMRYVIDIDKVEEVDFLSGDDRYKREWMDHRRERWGIMAFNPRTPLGVAFAVGRIGKYKARVIRDRMFSKNV